MTSTSEVAEEKAAKVDCELLMPSVHKKFDLNTETLFEKELGRLSYEERSGLEEEIASGRNCDPIHVWQRHGKLTIVDGHNNYSIREKLGAAPFLIIKHKFESDDEALNWMRGRQVARRSISEERRRLFVGRVWDSLGGRGKPKGEKADELAQLLGVERRSLQRLAALARAIDELPAKLRYAINDGAVVRVKLKDVKAFIEDLASSNSEQKAKMVEAVIEAGHFPKRAKPVKRSAAAKAKSAMGVLIRYAAAKFKRSKIDREAWLERLHQVELDLGLADPADEPNGEAEAVENGELVEA